MARVQGAHGRDEAHGVVGEEEGAAVGTEVGDGAVDMDETDGGLAGKSSSPPLDLRKEQTYRPDWDQTNWRHVDWKLWLRAQGGRVW